MISVGVIGCGKNFKVNHLPVLRKFKESGKIRISHVCDIDVSNAEHIANILGSDNFTRSYVHHLLTHNSKNHHRCTVNWKHYESTA